MCDWTNDEFRYTSPRIRAEREVTGLANEVDFWKGKIGRLISSLPLSSLKDKLANAEKRLESARAKLTAFTNV